jgi:beta-1,4-mannosyltransferase
VASRISAHRDGLRPENAILLDLRPGVARLDDIALEATDALRSLEALGHPRPILLACYPPGPSPFYSLLYARALECGVAPIPIRTIADAAALVPIAAVDGARVVLHLHWLYKVLEGVTNPAEGWRRVAEFEAELDRLLERSVAIVWTVHNILPHDAGLPECELTLRRAVVARASAIHVMAEATESILAPDLLLPTGRVFRVPHPAFTGVYPDWVDRPHARRVLGIPPSVPAIGLIGSLRPYKGLADLLDALPALTLRRAGIRLVVAGDVGSVSDMEETIDRAIAEPRVLIHPRHIPDDRIQDLMRGLDAVVLPYQRVLNSAALMLALAFDRPVVFPRDPALAEFADPALAVTYDRGSSDALAEAIDRVLALPPDDVVNATRRFCATRDPAVLSRSFAMELQERIVV